MSNEDYSKFDSLLDNLQELGRQNNRPNYRRFAVLHQSNQRKLGQIAQSEPDFQIRGLAVDKLKDEDTLFQIAQDDPENSVKTKAIERIKDPKKLLILRLTAGPELQHIIRRQYDLVKG